MLWVGGADGAITYVNRAWHDFTGDAADAPPRWLEAIHPDDRPAVERIYAQAVAARAAFALEYRLRRRDGTYRWAATRKAMRRSRSRSSAPLNSRRRASAPPLLSLPE